MFGLKSRWLIRATLPALIATAVTGALGGGAPAMASNVGGGGPALHVGEDPYASGCAAQSYPANSAKISSPEKGYFVTVTNYYSTSCRTNWAQMSWTGSNLDSALWIQNVPLIDGISHKQCVPENCEPTYSGQAQPMWTNLVEGIDQACIGLFHQGQGLFGIETTATDLVACA